ncbi:MAG TPA: AAA family ATPase, partial [Rubrivivax sp.]
MTTDLVERGESLALLAGGLAAAGGDGGRIVLVAGEAGIGKTSVLRAFAHTLPEAAVWWGACDALQTPHPLAPLLDIARERRPRFAAALDGPRAALFEAVLDELRLAAEPMLVVVEDAHWADDATLDLLKFLGRRIERTRALLAVSYRDDEVGASHPLRRVIGELPVAARINVPLPRLSPAAVETLARRAGRPAAGVHAATFGNAFFVTELLRDASDPRPAVPASVQDLVLARFARLPTGAQALLQALSVVPGRAERALVESTAAPALADIEAALGSGLLVSEGESFAYRHELGRVAIESMLSTPAAQSLHARVLAALVERGAAPARLVHHALRCGDQAAITRWAPQA